MMKRSLWFTLLTGTIVLSGCASVRVVTKYPNKGGVIAIHSQEDQKSREKAEEIMRTNCGSRGFEITEESEAIIGTKATTDTAIRSEPVQTKKTSFLGIPITQTTGGNSASSTTTTRQETEWRLTYKCNI